MNIAIRGSGARRWVPLVACLGLAIGVAAAQEPTEVTVTATHRAVVHEVGRGYATNAPIELTTITRHVDYSDLNLKTEEGAKRLQDRVKNAARQECLELDRLNPQLPSESTRCTHNVMTATQPQIEAAIRQAQRAAG